MKKLDYSLAKGIAESWLTKLGTFDPTVTLHRQKDDYIVFDTVNSLFYKFVKVEASQDKDRIYIWLLANDETAGLFIDEDDWENKSPKELLKLVKENALCLKREITSRLKSC